MEKDRLPYIAIASAIAILFIVLGHSLPLHFHFSNSDYFFPLISKVIAFIYTFHVPFLFFISGYLYLYTNPSGRKKKYPNFLQGKFTRLLIPFFLLSTLAFIPKALLSEHAANPIDLTWMAYFENFIYPWKNSVRYFWFLPTLFVIFVFAPLALKIVHLKPEKSKTISHLLIFALFLYCNYNFPKYVMPESILNYTGVLHYFLYFWLGMWAAYRFENKLDGWIREKCGALLIFTIAALCIHIFIFATFEKNATTDLVLSLTGISWVTALTLLISIKAVNTLKPIQKYSYQIYLLSWFFQVFTYTTLYKVFHLNSLSIFIITFIAGTIGPLICVYILNKFRVPGGRITIGL